MSILPSCLPRPPITSQLLFAQNSAKTTAMMPNRRVIDLMREKSKANTSRLQKKIRTNQLPIQGRFVGKTASAGVPPNADISQKRVAQTKTGYRKTTFGQGRMITLGGIRGALGVAGADGRGG